MSEINGDVKIRVIDSDKLIEAINEGSCELNLSAIMALGAAMMDTKKQEPMSDPISRQMAIDAITSYNGVVDKSVAKRILIQLPPEQSEIVGCKDCKHRGKQITDGRYWCGLHYAFMYYCSDAERKENR